jgi:hypothetical protein
MKVGSSADILFSPQALLEVSANKKPPTYRQRLSCIVTKLLRPPWRIDQPPEAQMFCDGELSLNVSATIVHLLRLEVNIVTKRTILPIINGEPIYFPLRPVSIPPGGFVYARLL